MRLFIICFTASSILIGCDNSSESITQKQGQQESTAPIVEATTEKIPENAPEAETVKADINTIKTKTLDAPKKFPILSFDEKMFNYGMIEQGDQVRHTFHFTNKGDADLIIKNAEASCGCTMPTYPFIPIKPGETGTIAVTFNSTGKMGTQRPNITVTSNSYPRTQTLYLEGFVTDQLAKKEEKASIIEEGIIIDMNENTAKGNTTTEVQTINIEGENN